MLPPIEFALLGFVLLSLVILLTLGIPHFTGQQRLTPATRRVCTYLLLVSAGLCTLLVLPPFLLILIVLVSVITVTGALLSAIVLDSIDPHIVPGITSLYHRQKANLRIKVVRTQREHPANEETRVA